MNWVETWAWVQDNYAVMIIGGAVIIYFLYQRFKKKEPEKQEDEGIKSFDTIHLEKGFLESNFLPSSKKDFYVKRLIDIRDDLSANRRMYVKAKQRYQEMLEFEKTLRQNIELLEQEKNNYIQKLRGMKDEGENKKHNQ